jgi:F0F1-type ATP synthase assembly protein I
MQTQTSPTQIDWRRLGIRLLATLVLPVLFALLLDRLLATSPFLTMVAAVICIPVATFVVIRTALLELGRIIDQVAPSEQKTDDAVAANDDGNGAPDATN